MLDGFKAFIDLLSTPSISFTLLLVTFPFIFPPTAWFESWHRRLGIHHLWTNRGGLGMFIALTLFMLLGFADPNFSKILSKPDNVPILILIYTAGFFLWLAMKSAYANDARLAAGEPVEERGSPDDKVLVWPDLVYIELIALILMTIFLIVWSVGLPAPLEEPANPTLSPNPAKAPWYFLGLQEMLVYFDPWLAGVIFPTFIIIGLMAIPYIDSDRATSGYFSFDRRRVGIFIFMTGWLVLWVFLIVVGTFFRGPNWNFFGPFEEWSVAKVVPLTNVNLSEYVWVKLLAVGLPTQALLREIVGILIVLFYFGLPPVLLARGKLRPLVERIGPTRYALIVFLALAMISLPIKMYLRWTINLKYIIAMPEYFFNI